jgi:hypothetical protein
VAIKILKRVRHPRNHTVQRLNNTFWG